MKSGAVHLQALSVLGTPIDQTNLDCVGDLDVLRLSGSTDDDGAELRGPFLLSPSVTRGTDVRAAAIAARRPLLVTLKAAIRCAKCERGLSQEEPAHRSAIDRSYMGSIERGGHNPGIVSLARIAHTTQMTLTELMAEAALQRAGADEARRRTP